MISSLVWAGCRDFAIAIALAMVRLALRGGEVTRLQLETSAAGWLGYHPRQGRGGWRFCRYPLAPVALLG